MVIPPPIAQQFQPCSPRQFYRNHWPVAGFINGTTGSCFALFVPLLPVEYVLPTLHRNPRNSKLTCYTHNRIGHVLCKCSGIDFIGLHVSGGFVGGVALRTPWGFAITCHGCAEWVARGSVVKQIVVVLSSWQLGEYGVKQLWKQGVKVERTFFGVYQQQQQIAAFASAVRPSAQQSNTNTVGKQDCETFPPSSLGVGLSIYNKNSVHIFYRARLDPLLFLFLALVSSPHL